MNNNIRVLLVNCDEIEGSLRSLELKEISKAKNGKEAIKEFVAEQFDVTFVHALPDEEEKALLASMLEINPGHYIVVLTDKVSPDAIVHALKHGASGILNKPFTTSKLRLELDKYSLFAEDEDRKVS